MSLCVVCGVTDPPDCRMYSHIIRGTASLKKVQKTVDCILKGMIARTSARFATKLKTVLPESDFVQRVNSVLQQHPYKVGVGLATVNGHASDLAVQKWVEQRETIDWRRNAMFTLFGFTWLGNVSWLIYVRGYNALFPKMAHFGSLNWAQKLKNKEGFRQVLAGSGLDLVLLSPLIFFPALYAFKEVVQQQDQTKEMSVDSICSAVWVSTYSLHLQKSNFIYPGQIFPTKHL